MFVSKKNSAHSFRRLPFCRHEASAQLRRCGLELILERARQLALLAGDGADPDDASTLGGCAADAPDLDARRLGAALRTFYSSLFSSATPEFSELASPARRVDARKRVATILADAHERVHQLASDPRHGGYADTDFLVHTPQQVRVLLDV